MRDLFLQRSGTSVDQLVHQPMETNLLIPVLLWVSFIWMRQLMFNTNHFGKYPRYIWFFFFFTSPSLFRTLPETFIHERLWFLWPPRGQAFVLADGELISRFAKGLHLLTLHPHKISTSSAAVYQPVWYKWDVMPTYIIHYMFPRVLCIHKVGICKCPLFGKILSIVS